MIMNQTEFVMALREVLLNHIIPVCAACVTIQKSVEKLIQTLDDSHVEQHEYAYDECSNKMYEIRPDTRILLMFFIKTSLDVRKICNMLS